jgi:hypothetical protein
VACTARTISAGAHPLDILRRHRESPGWRCRYAAKVDRGRSVATRTGRGCVSAPQRPFAGAWIGTEDNAAGLRDRLAAHHLPSLFTDQGTAGDPRFGESGTTKSGANACAGEAGGKSDPSDPAPWRAAAQPVSEDSGYRSHGVQLYFARRCISFVDLSPQVPRSTGLNHLRVHFSAARTRSL